MSPFLSYTKTDTPLSLTPTPIYTHTHTLSPSLTPLYLSHTPTLTVSYTDISQRDMHPHLQHNLFLSLSLCSSLTHYILLFMSSIPYGGSIFNEKFSVFDFFCSNVKVTSRHQTFFYLFLTKSFFSWNSIYPQKGKSKSESKLNEPKLPKKKNS